MPLHLSATVAHLLDAQELRQAAAQCEEMGWGEWVQVCSPRDLQVQLHTLYCFQLLWNRKKGPAFILR